jgi:hypothetical protein
MLKIAMSQPSPVPNSSVSPIITEKKYKCKVGIAFSKKFIKKLNIYSNKKSEFLSILYPR